MNNGTKMNTIEFEEELERIVGDNIDEKVFDEIDVLEPYNVLWKKNKQWNGYTVYSPFFVGKAPTIGLINEVLIKDGTARLATNDETLAYMDFVLTEEAKGKSLDELKAEQTEEN